MDIEISDLRLAQEAVGKLFGDDISVGPRGDLPEVFAPIAALKEWPEEVMQVKLNAPHGRAWIVPLHRVLIKHKGVPQGEAYRTNDRGLTALVSFKRACSVPVT